MDCINRTCADVLTGPETLIRFAIILAAIAAVAIVGLLGATLKGHQ